MSEGYVALCGDIRACIYAEKVEREVGLGGLDVYCRLVEKVAVGIIQEYVEQLGVYGTISERYHCAVARGHYCRLVGGGR